MRRLDRNELISLREALADVLQFVWEVKRQRTTYYGLQFENMINNIGIFLYSGDTDVYMINEILLRDWLNANDELLGIPGSDWFCAKTAKEAEDACRFLELIAIVEAYFLETEEADKEITINFEQQ